VQQIHATNAMVDQYYMESLPMMLQVNLFIFTGADVASTLTDIALLFPYFKLDSII
jgi:hypothetical protein